MKKKIIITSILLTILAISVVVSFLCGWTTPIKILMLCMLADYLIGISMALIGKSKKGGLKSNVGYTGIVKKSVTLFIVTITGVLEILLQVTYLQEVVTIAFICNELISINEHAQTLGLPTVNIIDLLKNKGVLKNDNKR